MASLYKRATPPQARILRAVEGAVKNAVHAHPDLQVSPRHMRSIAKRAAGTLTAQWPEVLAAKVMPSGWGVDHYANRRSTARTQGNQVHRKGKVSPVSAAFPVAVLVSRVARQIRGLKTAGETERVAAFIDVLRIIDDLRRPTPNTQGIE